MTTRFDKLIREAGEHETLTDAERRKLQFVVREYVALSPRRAPVAAPSAWQRLVRLRAVALATTVALLLAGSGGVAYAAEGALPGEALYGVKVGVLEPVGTLLTPPSGQAAWQMTLAERRLEESAALAARGTLSTSTADSLTANYEAHVTEASGALAREGQKSPLTARIAASGYAAQLDAYGTVLASAEHGSEAGNAVGLRVAIAHDIARFGMAESGQASSTEPVAEGRGVAATPAISPAAASALERAATAELQSSADAILAASSSLTGTSSVAAHAAYEAAANAADQGRSLLSAHDSAGASQAFQEAYASAARLGILARAASTLKIDVFSAASTTPAEPSDGSHRGHEQGGHTWHAPSGDTPPTDGATPSATPDAHGSDATTSPSSSSLETASSSVATTTGSAHGSGSSLLNLHTEGAAAAAAPSGTGDSPSAPSGTGESTHETTSTPVPPFPALLSPPEHSLLALAMAR